MAFTDLNAVTDIQTDNKKLIIMMIICIGNDLMVIRLFY